MPSRLQLEISFDLEGGADPLRGTLETGDAPPRAFWGWLQLIQAIEDAVRVPGAQPNRSLEDLNEHQDS
jgi:hypothetical protein